ncbi:MAG: PAS domain-containing protein [Chloroflexota bacterium]|nr:MAG: PAS domain-containing protein [Chloroflexota bacterium]
MTQKEIEVILSRQLAEYLNLAIFIVDPTGDLLYYNESAESILGSRFDDTGPMPAGDLAEIFKPMDRDGRPMEVEELPIVIALRDHCPAHSNFWIQGLDGAMRQIEVTAFPLMAQAQRFLGAIAIFWEVAYES